MSCTIHALRCNDLILDKTIERYLNQAKQNGYKVQLKHLTVLLVGTSGVGKTCFRHLLQGLDPPKKHYPTDLRESEKVMMLTKIDVQSDRTWVLLDRKNQINEIRKRLISKSLTIQDNLDNPELEHGDVVTNDKDATASSKQLPTLCDEDVPVGNEHDDPPKKDDEETKANNQTKYHKNITTSDNTATATEDNKTIHPNTSNKDYNGMYEDTSGGDHKSNINNDLCKCSVSEDKPSDVWNILTIIDTAGQPEFINLLPAVNQLSKITFVVFNMESELDSKVYIKRGDQNHDYTKGNLDKLHYSNSHAIESLLSMITHSAQCDNSYYTDDTKINEDDKFQVCMIGTHFDKIISNKGLIDKVNMKIQEIIQMSKINQFCRVWSFKGSSVFKMDTSRNYMKHTEQGDIAKTTTDAIETIRKIIHQILQKSTRNVATDISLNWLLLELFIQEECEKSNTLYMEQAQVINLATKENLKMNSNEIYTALTHLHKTGVLLFFSKGGKILSDVIFPNPNKLFERLTKVVNIIQSKECLSDDHVCALEEQGVLHKEMLCNENLFQEKEIETLLVLLEHMKIITMMRKQEKSIAENITYFMPCVLPSYKLNKDESVTTENCKAEPLHIKFKFGMIPRGIFCSLVVALLKNQNFSLHVVKKRYNNFITFQTNTDDMVELRDWVNYFEIIVNSNNNHDEENNDFIYYQVQHYITCALIDVWKDYELLAANSKHSNLESSDFIEYGFWCGECKKDIASVTKTEFNKIRCGGRACSVQRKLEDKHKVWFVYKVSN